MSATSAVAEPLTAEVRMGIGKGPARQARRDGKIPAVLYGDGEPTRHLMVPAREFAHRLRRSPFAVEIDFEGRTFLTSPVEIQRHPVRRTIQHVDLRIVTPEQVAATTAAAAMSAAAEAARLAAIEAAAADAAALRAAAAAAAAASADKKPRK